MHVPTSGLLTVHSVPSNFANKETRKKLTVHALLAAYLAFGWKDGHLKKYGRWMATWPTLSDFATGMPLFFDERLSGSIASVDSWTVRGDATIESIHSSRKGVEASGQKAANGTGMRFIPFSPAVCGEWCTLPSAIKKPTRSGKGTPISKVIDPANSEGVGLQEAQARKLAKDIKNLAECFPERCSTLQDPTSPELQRFQHMWCCVNTRCFYYVAPGEEQPEDSNEAMALCPGMDLFNHIDRNGVEVHYDATGYYVVADKDYDVGEEIYLSYGAHNNDTLWVEYGFLLDNNREDFLKIDAVVLAGKQDDQLLDQYDYFGDYTLRVDGLCWRAEAVAWLEVLGPRRWEEMMAGNTNPEADEDLRRKAKSKLADWVMAVKREAENSLQGLLMFTLQDKMAVFGSSNVTENGLAQVDKDLPEGQTQPLLRHSMCINRWKQIWNMCMDAMRAIEDDCPGAFVTGTVGRTVDDLKVDVDDILVNLQK